MKKSLFLCFILLISLHSLISASDSLTNNRISFIPDHPIKGSPFQMFYNPKGTNLENETEVYAAYYSLINDKTVAHSVPMTKNGDTWSASINPETDAISIGFKFFSGDISDSNNSSGYCIELHGTDNKPIPGAYTDMLYLKVHAAYNLGIMVDLSLKNELFETLKNEFSVRPETKQKYIDIYLSLLKTLYKDDGENAVKEEIINNADRNDLSEAEIYTYYNQCKKYNLKDKMDLYEQKLKEKNPNHLIFVNNKVMKYISIQDPAERTKFLSEMRQEYPDNWQIGYWQKLEVKNLLKEKKIDKAQEYITQSPAVGDCCYYSDGAQILLDEGIDNNLALEMSRKGVELMRADLINQKDKKPASNTEYDWQKAQNNHFSRHLKTEGLVLMKLENFAEAVNVLEEAAILRKYQDPETNEVYCSALIKKGMLEKAVKEMSEFIINNNSTFEMEKMFIDANLALKQEKNIAEAELEKLRNSSYERLKKRFVKELVSIPAPSFTLTDLDGKKVTLEDFKGKTVILDFWATWCGPCIVSFPTMQKMVDKYKDDTSIKFIFINTKDYDDKTTERVKDFLAEDNYKFYILLDDKYNKTANDYALSGIPTKIVIDKEGKIRFQYTGWKGNEDKEMKMFEAIIDLIR